MPPALGLVRTPAYPAPYVARFGPGGGLDPDFGDGGVALPGGAIFSQHFAGATTLALDAGRAMVGGYVQREGEEVDNFFLLRLEDRLIFADGFESRNTTWW